MKKIFFCIFAFFAITPLYAQDIIVTKDSKKIEATIIEVSKTEIKYKEYDNIEGPIFILDSSELSSIIYANGKVVLYNQKENLPQSNESANTQQPTHFSVVDEKTVEILLLSGDRITAQVVDLKANYIAYVLNGQTYTMPSSQIERVTFLQSGQIKEYNGNVNVNKNTVTQEKYSPKYISRSGNTYYYDGRTMRGDSYASFLSQNCTLAYNQYKKGENVAIAGWILFGVGVGLDLGFSWWLEYSWIPALACEIACIPTLIVGYNKMHKSADVFNANCATKHPQAYWSFNASQNGFGIAYNF